MDKRVDCQLTIKDLSILEVMLQRHNNADGPFLRLLRRKLATATVVFQDTIDPRAATLNSRIEISVDGGPAESRILAYGGEDAYPGIALPITSLLGLSLLGLTAPRTIVCERPDGTTEEVQLRRIVHQPEAAKQSRVAHSLAVGAPQESHPSSRPSVIALAARRRATQRGSVLGQRHDPDGDDPGPPAA